MNYNISVYIVFIALMVFLIVYVGQYFYANGRVFLVSLLRGNLQLADSINRLLLTGYWLVNIGYAFLKLRSWQKLSSLADWLASLSGNMAALILLLALLHYLNMLVLFLLSKSNSLTHKSLQS